MTRGRIITAAVVVLASALAVAEFLRGPRSMFFGFDRGMQGRYEDFSIGSSRDAAIESLGAPLSKSATFRLPQRKGFERYFDEAERSNAVDYLLWINGGNWYYCIGFDAAGKAVVKGEGHS